LKKASAFRRVAPANGALILLHKPRVNAVLMMHVHAGQQPQFIALRERHQTNTAAQARVNVGKTQALLCSKEGGTHAPALRVFAGGTRINVFGLYEGGTVVV